MIYVFLADGFEEIEALTPVDLLRRAGKEVVTVGVGGRSITGAHGITADADICDSDISEIPAGLEMAVLPGGMPGAANLAESAAVDRVIEFAAANSRIIAAICAAPAVVLGRYAFTHGRRMTCYPGFEELLERSVVTGNGVEEDGDLITAKGPGMAMNFALALVSRLSGASAAENLKGSLQC